MKNDASGKFQFNYNRVTAFSNNYPEIDVGDKPLILAPGEGNVYAMMGPRKGSNTNEV